jgi:outer membrane receptor protein involved in Fe transport
MTRPTTVAAAVASILAGAPLAAQNATSGDAGTLEEVVVTATRRAENILDVPYNISAVSGEQIEAQQILDTPELLRSIPGVGIVDRGQRNAAVVNGIRIRGLNVDSSALGDYAVSAVSTVSTYVGDTPIFSNFLLKDVERVEVLRGPQGTLYGSGSLGGTVRYVLRQPEFTDTSGRVAASFSQVDGSDGTGWAGDATLNLPVTDHFALRANVSRADYPGVTDYVNLYQLDAAGIPLAPSGVLSPAASYTSKKDADTVEIWYARLAARWQPSDRWDLTLSHFYQDDKVGGRRQPSLGTDGFGRAYGKYENGSIQLEPSSRNVNLTSLEADVDLGFATLTSSSSYYDHEGDSVSENTGFYAQAGFLSFYYNYPRPMASAVRTYRDKAFIQELRLVSQGEGALKYVVGLYYQDQDLLSTQSSYLRGFKRWWNAAVPTAQAAVTGDQDFAYRRKENFKDKAIYGELTWSASDRLSFTGGLRYFDNESRNDTFVDIPVYASFSNPTNATFIAKESDTLFKGNVSFKLGDDELLYATASQGYRRGGSNAIPLSGNFAEAPIWATAQQYDADRVTNYEIGLKGTFGRVRYDANVFRIDWKDPQLSTSTPAWGYYITLNGDKAQSQGLELQLTGDFTDQLGFGFGYTYTKAELAADFKSVTGAVIEVDGASLPGAPKQMLNASLNYRQPLGSGRNLYFNVDGYYQSSSENALSRSTQFDATIDSFQLWNCSVALVADAWSAALWVKNIANEAGVTGVYKEQYMGSRPSVGYFGNGSKELISLPRTIGLTLTYSF